MLKRFIFGLLIAATSAQAALGKDFSKTTSAAPPEPVHWPLLWTHGEPLDYDDSTEHILETKGVGTRTHSRGITRIWTSRGSEGVVQRWTSLASLGRETNTSEAEQAFMQEMEREFRDTTLEVRLTEEGTFSGIANIQVIQSRYQEIFNAWLEREGKKNKAPVAMEDEKIRQRLLAAYTSVPVLEAQLSNLPSAYNFPSGGGLGLDFEYEYEDQGANPLGGEPFPMTGRMTLSPDELHPGWLMLEWTIGIDREKGGPILAEAVRKLLGEEFTAKGGKEKAEALQELSSDLDIGSSTRFRIDPKTGIVQWMQFVQRRRVGDRNDLRTSTLSLRAEPYVKPEAAPIPAPQG